jgi:hypothetical protein
VSTSKKILIAPLDWGLGHAARCVPVIHSLIKRGYNVNLGGSGLSGKLLQMEFPSLPYFEIPGYEVSYSSTLPMSIAMLRQAPGILRSIQSEKKWLEQKVESNKFDIVISDHRYGLYNKNAYSIFMGHQLFISTGSSDLLEPVLWKINKSYIGNFDRCWIPDLPGEENASGKLSHKNLIPFPHDYVGLLSRFSPGKNTEKKYEAAFILSGLEPLRTDLENLLIRQSYDLDKGKYILIRGTDQPIQKKVPDHVEVIDLADSKKVEEVIGQSEIMVSRAGYSSIMDYIVTGCKAILIATPGQTEQEYLAKYHYESGNFYRVEQAKLDLKNDLKLGFTFSPQFSNDETLLDKAIMGLP